VTEGNRLRHAVCEDAERDSFAARCFLPSAGLVPRSACLQRAAELRAALVACEEPVHGEEGERAAEEPEGRLRTAGVLLRLGNDVEGQRAEQDAAAEHGHRGGNALPHGQEGAGEGADDQRAADRHAPEDRFEKRAHARRLSS
jgi:hypothetical protein